MADLWHAAAAFAAHAHRHHARRDGVTPYFAHPARVALIVASRFGVCDEVTLAAALLHDVIEDCDVDYDDLETRFGKDVADLVATLSKDKRLVEPERESAYDAQLARGSWRARLIKLADVCDNLLDSHSPARSTLLETAQRALDLAAGDAKLEEPSRYLNGLMAEYRESMV